MSNTTNSRNRTRRSLTETDRIKRHLFGLGAGVVALGIAASTASAAADEYEDLLGVDAFLGEVVDIEANAAGQAAFERMLVDVAADLPLDHRPVVPVDPTARVGRTADQGVDRG